MPPSAHMMFDKNKEIDLDSLILGKETRAQSAVDRLLGCGVVWLL
jgi:hypothetical protein